MSLIDLKLSRFKKKKPTKAENDFAVEALKPSPKNEEEAREYDYGRQEEQARPAPKRGPGSLTANIGPLPQPKTNSITANPQSSIKMGKLPQAESKASEAMPHNEANLRGSIEPMPSHSNGAMARDRLDRLIRPPKVSKVNLEDSSSESSSIKGEIKKKEAETKNNIQKTKYLKRLMGN